LSLKVQKSQTSNFTTWGLLCTQKKRGWARGPQKEDG
jgi:hypothetical protein